jgi:hypothetical protein
MTIKVDLDIISHEDMTKILDYYNQNRSIGDEPISRLPRYEGGFQIRISHMKDVLCDDNIKKNNCVGINNVWFQVFI